MGDTGEAAIFEAEEFEVVDECVDEDEGTSEKDLEKISTNNPATSSALEKSTGSSQNAEESQPKSPKSTCHEKLELINKTCRDEEIQKKQNNKEVPKTTKSTQVKNGPVEGRLQKKQQILRIQKPIDFTADISMEQLDAPGAYMTDEEIMNHLDEIENIVLDGTSFELQDESDQSISVLSESDVQKTPTKETSHKSNDKSPGDENIRDEVKNTIENRNEQMKVQVEGTKSQKSSSEIIVIDLGRSVPESEDKPISTEWYEKKLETKVATVKDRFSKLARVLEFSYPRYKTWLDRNEALLGSPVCRLDAPRRCSLEKPHTNRWKFICNRKPVQESTEKQSTNKEESSGNTNSTMWRLTPTGVWGSNTDNSSEYPPFVMKAVKVFEDFLQSTPPLDESSAQSAGELTADGNEAPKSEGASSCTDADDKENNQQQWLWLLVRCNRDDELMLFATGKNIERATMDNLKQVYETGPGKDCKVKSLYCKSIVKVGGTTSNTTTFLVGSEALDEKVGGIKIQLAPKTNFWSNAAGAESLGNTVADFVSPTPKTTVVEIGCGTGLIGLMLASKCHQVIGLDSPSEVEEAEMTSELNGIKNASFVMGEPSEVMTTISKVLSNCRAVAIVNTNTNIGRAIEVMTNLRKITSLGRLVLVTTLTKQSVRSILELTRPSDGSLGNPFLPTRACVVDTLPIGPHFEVVILMERRNINKFPEHWVLPGLPKSAQSLSHENKGAANSNRPNVSGLSRKQKIILNRSLKLANPPAKQQAVKGGPPVKKGKSVPATKKGQFPTTKPIKTLPPPKNKFTKRIHSPDRPHVPPKKFAGKFDRGNFKPWITERVSSEYKPHESNRGANRFDDTTRKNVPYRSRSPIIMKDDLERHNSRSWIEENPIHRGSPTRDKRFRDHKEQSDLRERLSSSRIEPEIMEKVKKQQQMLEVAKQKLSGPSASVDAATAKQLHSMLNMVLEQTNKLQSQLPRSVWDRIAPPENMPGPSSVQSPNDPLLKGRYVQEMGTQDILITTANREFLQPNESMSRGSYDRFNAIPPSRNNHLSSNLTMRQDCGPDQFQNIGPERFRDPGVDYHDRDEEGNPWNRDKQSDKNRWEPFQELKKSTSPNRKPMSPLRHHLPQIGRPASPRRVASPLRRPLSPMRHPISPQRRHISPLMRDMSPPRRQISPQRCQISPRHQLSPSRRHISPPRRGMSSPRHHVSPSRRHLSPTRHQLSPSRRVDDDWDIPSRGAIEQNNWQRPRERVPEQRRPDRQPSGNFNWDHSSGNERYRKPVNQDKWDIKDSSHDAIWTSGTGSGDAWEPKQQTVVSNQEHWQPKNENRWQNSSSGSNGDNWNIRGKESFSKPLTREEPKMPWTDGKQRWGDLGGPSKESWGQADKEDWNDLPEDAKDPWGDDGNNANKDRWPKYDNPGMSSGWSRENQIGDVWAKPNNDNWQNKSTPVNKPQWQPSPSGQYNMEPRWTSNEAPKKTSLSGAWQGNTNTANNWQPQNYSGFQQSRSYNPGSFKDRR